MPRSVSTFNSQDSKAPAQGVLGESSRTSASCQADQHASNLKSGLTVADRCFSKVLLAVIGHLNQQVLPDFRLRQTAPERC